MSSYLPSAMIASPTPPSRSSHQIDMKPVFLIVDLTCDHYQKYGKRKPGGRKLTHDLSLRPSLLAYLVFNSSQCAHSIRSLGRSLTRAALCPTPCMPASPAIVDSFSFAWEQFTKSKTLAWPTNRHSKMVTTFEFHRKQLCSFTP